MPGARRVAFLAVGALAALSPSASADRSWDAPPKQSVALNLEIFRIEVGVLSPDLASASFQTDFDAPMRGGKPAPSSLRGDALGYTRPVLVDLRVALATLRIHDWFLVGLHMGGGFGWLPDASAAHDAGASSSINVVGGGVHLGLVYTRRVLDLRLVGDLGGRSFAVDLDGFDAMACHHRDGTLYSCRPVARAGEFYFQARLQLGFSLSPLVTLGAYGGLDASTGVGWIAGAFIGFHIMPWSGR
jgi:hypothetical protein